MQTLAMHAHSPSNAPGRVWVYRLTLCCRMGPPCPRSVARWLSIASTAPPAKALAARRGDSSVAVKKIAYLSAQAAASCEEGSSAGQRYVACAGHYVALCWPAPANPRKFEIPQHATTPGKACAALPSTAHCASHCLSPDLRGWQPHPEPGCSAGRCCTPACQLAPSWLPLFARLESG
jgi:hypothetical protein